MAAACAADQFLLAAIPRFERDPPLASQAPGADIVDESLDLLQLWAELWRK